VGERKSAPARPILGPESSAKPALERLLSERVLHPEMVDEFGDLCAETLELIQPLFEGIRLIRVHGDLHRGNLLESGDPPGPVLIDFDDAALGPAVQDLWLFLPGRLIESRRELNLLLEGYREIRPFDRRETALIEPLRFMRMLCYLDWQARQREDDGFRRAFPDWGGRAFWLKELEDLRDQARVIAEEEPEDGPALP
jgi:Ser/Thr protein kinase RdoA (MazF antagonist)